MAKNKVQPTNEEVEVIEPDVKTKNNKKESLNKAKDDVDAKSKGKDKAKSKPKKERKSLKKKAAEVMSELKKVSKPSFGTVVKNTCVVIAVVAICTLLLFGVDKLFSLVYDLLLP